MACLVRRKTRWYVVLSEGGKKTWIALPKDITTKAAAMKAAVELEGERDRRRLGLSSPSSRESSPAPPASPAGILGAEIERRRTGQKTRGWAAELECFSARLVAWLGSRELTPRLASDYLAFRAAHPSTLRKEVRFFRAAWARALAPGAINPWADVRLPAEPPARDRWLSSVEFEALLAAASPRRRLRYLLLAYTGARRGEARQIRRRDVDLDGRSIRIANAAKGGGPGARFRVVPIPAPLLEPLRERCAGLAPDDVVLEGEHSWRRDLLADCRRAQIAPATPHDLRHTYCSWLVQRGIDLRTVAELAGHASVVTTQRYAHLAPEQHRAAMRALDFAVPPADPG